MARLATYELSRFLNTEIEIKSIDTGLFNRIIINDLSLNDTTGQNMLTVSRLSAKIDILPLFNKHISIRSVQLFGFNINLYKDSLHSKPNFQFLIDKFARKGPLEKPVDLNLRINSILVRRGKLSYHVLSEPNEPGKFDKNHLDFQNIIANISLKALQKDSINASIKRFCVSETSSGLTLNKLKFKLLAGSNDLDLKDFEVELPGSSFKLDTLAIHYDSLALLPSNWEQAIFKVSTKPSHITLSDIAPFVPTLKHFNEPLNFNFKFNGMIDHLNCPTFNFSKGNDLQFTSNISVSNITEIHDALVHGNVSKLYVNEEGFDFLFRNLKEDYNQQLPPAVKNLKHILFSGEVSGFFTDLVMYGQLNTGIGSIHTDIKLTADKEKHLFAYSGNVKTSDFSLQDLLPGKKLGHTSLNVNVNGRHTADRYPTISVKGDISTFDYSGYTYHDIILDGKYTKGGFEGDLNLNDENIKLAVNGTFNTALRKPVFKLTTALSDFRPEMLNLTPKKFKDTSIGMKIKADFSGSNLDDLNGNFSIDSLLFSKPEQDIMLDHFYINASSFDNGENDITVDSPFLKGEITGNFNYATLPTSFINLLHGHLPSIVNKGKSRREPDNTLKFGFRLSDSKFFSDALGIPLHIYAPSDIRGSYSDNTQKVRIEGYFPRMQYGNNYIESGMLLLHNPENDIELTARITNFKGNNPISVSMTGKASDDKTNLTLNWGNSQSETYSGKIAAEAKFIRNEEDRSLLTHIQMTPTDIILNDTLWKMHPSDILVKSGKVKIHNFQFSSGERYLKADGVISKEKTDTIQVDLKDINLGYVFDIVNLTDAVKFGGDATGHVTGCNILTKPDLDARLHISNFTLNNGLLGETNIYGTWLNEKKAIYLDTYIKNEANATSHVEGFIYPIKPNGGLDLNIDADQLNVKFLEHYMGNIARDVQGTASGHINFSGKFKALNLSGVVKTNASLAFDVLGTSFRVNDTIRMDHNGITFDNVSIADVEGNTGKMNGYLHYHHFKDLKYRFDINVSKMLIMDIPESLDFPFNGKVYGTGNALLSGDAVRGLEVNAALTTDKNTVFTYSIGTIASATSNQFIEFVDKTPKNMRDSIQIYSHYDQLQQKKEELTNNAIADIRLNIQIDATPEAKMRILMDPVAGDNISGRGSGNIRVEFYNKGDVKLFGNYRISQGVYKFSLQEVIRKDFMIQDGSTISFNGAPMDANMNIHAIYSVPSASISDLIPDASQFIQQPNVRVNCLMDLNGALVHPSIKFGISLPNERDEIQSLIRNYISTEEQMNMQILYLLGIGKFYTENNINASDRQSSDMMSSVISSTLSGQLNNLLSQVIDNSNWNIGTNLSTGEKGWTDVEVEGVLSGQLLNNRLIINGNFGYRDNPMANTNFIGDFEAEWLLTRNGDYRLRAYNETNDRYYTKTNLTTQGIGFIYRKEFQKWKELLFWNNWKLKRRKRKQEKLEKEQQEKAAAQRKREENRQDIAPEPRTYDSEDDVQMEDEL